MVTPIDPRPRELGGSIPGTGEQGPGATRGLTVAPSGSFQVRPFLTQSGMARGMRISGALEAARKRYDHLPRALSAFCPSHCDPKEVPLACAPSLCPAFPVPTHSARVSTVCDLSARPPCESPLKCSVQPGLRRVQRQQENVCALVSSLSLGRPEGAEGGARFSGLARPSRSPGPRRPSGAEPQYPWATGTPRTPWASREGWPAGEYGAPLDGLVWCWDWGWGRRSGAGVRVCQDPAASSSDLGDCRPALHLRAELEGGQDVESRVCQASPTPM